MQRTCTNTESVARPNLLILSILLILSKQKTERNELVNARMRASGAGRNVVGLHLRRGKW